MFSVDASGDANMLNGSNGGCGGEHDSSSSSEEDRGEAGSDGGSSSGDEDDGEGLGAAARWKASMLERAAGLFAERSTDLQAFVYGQRGGAATLDGRRRSGGGGDNDGSDESDGELFKPVGQQAKAKAPGVTDLEAVDGEGVCVCAYFVCSLGQGRSKDKSCSTSSSPSSSSIPRHA